MRKKDRKARFLRFLDDVREHTPFTRLALLLVVLWLVFAAALFVAERGADGASIDSYGKAMYWGIAAFSTAGIADTPATGAGRFIGGAWIVIGSLLFFGAIVATVTAYFMRPLQRPHKKIIETIEYNLEQLEQLNLDELDLLHETVDTLIEHVERIKVGRK
jgi:voltage-gated potassium channel